MKTILVDAVHAFVSSEGEIFQDMYNLLEKYPNKKIILTGANDEQFLKFGLNKMPYEVFTLKHDPEKTNPKYFKTMLEYYNFKIEDVIYFEHDLEAVKSAQSIGINSFYYDSGKKDLEELKKFLDLNL